MSELTPQQEQAIATFKSNLHLPNDGFHTLITELCKEYQLPFQKVRSTVVKAQRTVEKRIRHEFEQLNDNDLTKEQWLKSINLSLVALAKDNQSVMERLESDTNYVKALEMLDSSIDSEDHREELLELLYLAYEKTVFKPLAAMLHTNPLYWKLMLAEELYQMTEETRQKFSDYPQYMEAAETLFELDQKARALELGMK
ncbi:hypothetical protein KP803_11355 [Vibrio sp. ZSDE26]|uniref:Uncharacterized protein n=1 Tax=Vibrio amylolyticus TaxID=2847292 RepID=A0A9X1XKK2_9VIBR|nr:hypothetical protein [Vibrio amylolyticus]MCK6263865.1 hypothetical protein [Vibrio amylolyticus]